MPEKLNNLSKLILITGGSGSGKSLLVESIKSVVPNECTVIPQDNYYLSFKDAPEQLKIKNPPKNTPRYNVDHVDAFNWDLLLSHLNLLLDGQEIEMPIYDYSIMDSPNNKVVESTGYIILEGIFSFFDPRIRDLSKDKIFVHVDADIRLARRILRDLIRKDRDIGLTPELDQDEIDSLMHYINYVKPGYDDFVEPTKKYADMVVDNNKFTKEPEMVPQTLKFLNLI